ncbi:hypothetical protein GCM10010321_34340 [Streptomyces chartreusis]|nr:hypothetical protein GCM10010321_34340 [Streptomyces chartreusis]
MKSVRWFFEEFTFKGLLLIPAAILVVAAFAAVVMLVSPGDGPRRPADSPTPTSFTPAWECAQDPETGDVDDCWELSTP